MAKSNRLNKPRNKRPRKPQSRVQVVYSGPKRIFKEKYLTKKGKELMLTATTKKEKEAIWAKYGKNKYVDNPKAKPVFELTHRV